MARVTLNFNTLQELYKKHYYGNVCLENDERININQLRRNVIRTNNSRKLSYCVPLYGTLNRRS